MLGTVWRIQLKFGIGGAPPQGNSHINFVCFCSRSVELQMCENGIFFTPVKYTLVCRVPQVSWAARHTTVCLDHEGLGFLVPKYHPKTSLIFSEGWLGIAKPKNVFRSTINPSTKLI